jgi:hypothetical protein
MGSNNQSWTGIAMGLFFASVTLAVACGGGYEAEGEYGDLGEDVAGDLDGEGEEAAVAVSKAETALEAGEEPDDFSLIEDTQHTEAELAEYRARLAEYKDAYSVDKAGGVCGSRKSFWDQVVTAFVPPDHFPPDSIVGLPIGLATAPCALFGVANFSKAGCQHHDKCYSAPGRTRESCDREFRRNLRGECNSTYGGWFEAPCRSACRAVAQLMYEAVSSGGASAYAAAQRRPTGSSAPPRQFDPACVSTCENNCTFLQYDQIGMCQYGCPAACGQ